MTNYNNLKPIENKKPVETVYELKNEYKIPSFEEFMKTYEPNEAVELITEAEFQDRLLHSSRYGPGFWSWASKVAITTGAGIVLGPAAIPVGAAVWGTSEIIKNNVDDEDTKKVFGFVSDCGRDTLTGGVIGVAAQGVGAVAGFNKFAGLGKNCEGALNSAIHGIKVSGTIEFWTSKGFEAKDALNHIIHKRDYGIEYKVGCKICES